MAQECGSPIGNVGHRLGMWVTGYELSTSDADPESETYPFRSKF